MQDFKHITDWKLKSGSHEFPGPDGGTCINEAAIVVAGFEYKKISSAADCPPCFSRPVAQFAIALNDGMPDEMRQQLLTPFVTRLAGTADDYAVENRRAEFMLVEITRTIFLPLFIRLGGGQLSARAAMVRELYDVEQFAHMGLKYNDEINRDCVFFDRWGISPSYAFRALQALYDGVQSLTAPQRYRNFITPMYVDNYTDPVMMTYDFRDNLIKSAAEAGAAVARVAGAVASPRFGEETFCAAVRILDGMIKLGKGTSIGSDEAIARMKAVSPKERSEVRLMENV